MGFPTANLQTEPGLCGEWKGIWLARVAIEGKRDELHWALVNIGSRPTVSQEETCTVEAWLIRFDGDLYGQELEIELLKYMRPEKRFPSVEELRLALEADKQEAMQIINRYESGL